jgi:hypothetical protein
LGPQFVLPLDDRTACVGASPGGKQPRGELAGLALGQVTDVEGHGVPTVGRRQVLGQLFT